MSALLLCSALISSCSTTASGNTGDLIAPSSSPEEAVSKSTIVSQLDNYYQENPALSIDPCHDTFIRNMESIGYALHAKIILPRGEQYFGHWYAECQYESETVSALVQSSTAPFMLANESLTPEHDNKSTSRIIEIEGRQSVVRPSANWGSGCSISMTTAFGSMTISGGEFPTRDHEVDCDRIIELLRQIEPWIND